jgi:hypothetical protein
MDATVISYVSIIVSVGALVIGGINHKKIRSNCCGKRGELSFDIDKTSPIIPRKVSFHEPPVVNP